MIFQDDFVLEKYERLVDFPEILGFTSNNLQHLADRSMFYRLEYAEKIQETAYCQELFSNYDKASDYLKAVYECFNTTYLEGNEFRKEFLDNLSQIVLAKGIKSVLFILAALQVTYEQAIKKGASQGDHSNLYLVLGDSDLEKELANLDLRFQSDLRSVIFDFI